MALATMALLVLVLFVALAYLFEDEIVKGVKLKIDEQLETRVTVGEVNFSMLERFPYASIKFEDVWIEDKLVEKDTLLYAQEVFLSFNMMDIVSKNYVIKKAEINTGQIAMRRDNNGASNYIFWHESQDSSSSVSFDIEELTVNKVDYSYDLGDEKFNLDGFLDKLELSGGIDANGLALENTTRLDLHSLSYSGEKYIENQKTTLEGGISLAKDNKTLSFNNFSIAFGEIELPITGEIFEKKDVWNVDLKTSHEAELHEILSVLSKEVNDKLTSYEMDGDLSYNAHLKGAIKDNEVPLLRVNFNLKKGNVTENESNIALGNINFVGAYQSLQKGSERLEIQKLNSTLVGGKLNVNGAVENFDNPWLNLDLQSNFDVEDLQRFLKVESIDNMNGKLVINSKFKGSLPNKNISKSDLDRLKISGQMELAEMDLRLKGSTQTFGSLNGKVEFDDNNLIIHSLTGAVNGSEFDASGKMNGFVQYLLNKQDKLNLVAKINSPHLNLDALLAEGNSDGQASFNLDGKVDFTFDAGIGQLTYKDFVADNINAQIVIKEGLLRANKVRFTSAEGTVHGNLAIKRSKENNFEVTAETDLKGIQISEVFSQFDNFGQDFLKSQHLDGQGNAEVIYQSSMDGNLSIDPRSITCNADIEIEDGELIQLDAMNDIYLALNDNKIIRPFVKLTELKNALSHLEFSKLENQINIKNGEILIPEMSISSNAMNINIAGRHSFENEIDYQFNFKLSEILVRRETSEFGTIADDGTGAKLFMRMYGTTDNPQFEMDKKGAKKSRKEDFIAEKKKFKEIINTEILNKGEKIPDLKNEKEDQPVITVIQDDHKEGVIAQKQESSPKKTGFSTIEVDGDDEELEDDDDF